MEKKIVFLMPREASWPSGGLKVVLEYANRLSQRGNNVKLVYPMFRINESFDWLHSLFYFFLFFFIKYKKKYKPDKWFDIDANIEQVFVRSLENFKYNKEDIYVATAIHTAYSLQRYKTPESHKFYFIQGFENWTYSNQEVIDSYHFKMHKIVISNWLHEILLNIGEMADIVYNGFDFKTFILSTPIHKRSPYEIICLYHKSNLKDFPTAYGALIKVKSICPGLHVSLFGVPSEPKLPDWFTYYQSPDKNQLVKLYNNAAIYVGSSKVEGWGLTIGEAMLCGCAVVCTNNRGYLEMAKHKKTALVSEIEDVDALASNIISLIEDNRQRIEIAEAGNKYIKNFNIEDSFLKFEKIITC
ncbi:glycosyltransferase family 4 protein [Hoylesella buccalis]|uniref:Glycosyl transferase family 1 domain-containing protein n=1 Tax=Hoylesella buccalis DNF00853 TaxID=1401074 RepID=A0A095ZPG6_9BACT|nr:glycosyltransferase family 4 protein [Hoylesella buccalis]KGF36655.1 hypothetical protein HMPREF2137_01265 [Hoylesella buccalis DNF00853]